VRKWFSDAQNTIAKEEAAYITNQDDLVQLVPKTTTPLQIIPKMTAWYKAVYDRPGNPASIGTGIATAGALMLVAPSWIRGFMDKLVAYAMTSLMVCCFTVVTLTVVACFTAAILAIWG
jgi:hypothetical protein